ncbi:MAG: superoxide dismutase [Defluviitaleaceae bacterium]|nr:superoxide dismutase [Defluviitaleaceae bacterium]
MEDNKENHFPFSLKPLPYDTSALEPYIDKKTMEIHHSKHVKAYVDNLNKALETYPKYHDWSLEKLLYNLDDLPKDIRQTVKNNAGGVFNHNFFFDILKKDVEIYDSNLITKINEKFGSIENFKTEFKNAALSVFGSGWVWLVSDKDGNISIEKSANQDNLISENLFPIIAIDVWEHAYYLLYQNRRNEYIDNFFNVINWDKAVENYEKHTTTNYNK